MVECFIYSLKSCNCMNGRDTKPWKLCLLELLLLNHWLQTRVGNACEYQRDLRTIKRIFVVSGSLSVDGVLLYPVEMGWFFSTRCVIYMYMQQLWSIDMKNVYCMQVWNILFTNMNIMNCIIFIARTMLNQV